MSVQPSHTMYAAFFGLQQPPFSIAPDPRYLYMSERHREALAHLLYGVGGGGGFVLLSGEIGAGKTTVCRCFLEQIPRRCNVAYIFNPKLTAVELLQSVCDEFRLPPRPVSTNAPTVKDYLDPLNEFLLRTHAVGQNNVLIIDEAQNLSADVLEQLRLLTNLETNERKLLQIILIGQPELRGLLGRPDLEQLAQRVIARYHLDALSEGETAHYIRHRMAVAGLTGALPFDRKALRRIHRLSRGVPRRINLLCDRALLGAYADNRTQVDIRIVDKAAAEVFSSPQRGRAQQRRGRSRWLDRVATASAVIALVAGAWFAGMRWSGPQRNPPHKVLATGAVASRPASGVGPSAASSPATSVDALMAAPITDERAAWRQLALAWHVTLPIGGDPCQDAAAQRLRCYRKVSPLSLVRALGRPGVLVLQPGRGRPVYALLTGLSVDSAVLQAGAATYRVSLMELASVWHGDFATFWRDAGNGLVWDAQSLDAQLTAAQGSASPSAASAASVDDASLRSRVRAFQLATGLEPDGIAGPTTYMQLNRATGVDEPRLPMKG